MNKILVFLLTFSVFSNIATAQTPSENPDFNPIFELYDQQTPIDEKKQGYAELEMKYISYKKSAYTPYWIESIHQAKGHFFLMETEYPLADGSVLVFSQLRSNLTCANFGEYTEPYQGSENCLTRFILIDKDGFRFTQLDNIWMNANNDKIYVKPETGKELFDILINENWYTYSKKDSKYIKSQKNI